MTLLRKPVSYTHLNPEKLAENLQKQGAYIPSVWPGKDTQKYVSKILIDVYKRQVYKKL